MVQLAGELFAQKGYRATTVREIADAAGILSGSLYHHFDSKESIGDEILSGFINQVLTNYRAADACAVRLQTDAIATPGARWVCTISASG